MIDFLEQRLIDVPIVVLDTETTGLNPHAGHRVVEIGAVRFDPDPANRWRVSEQFDRLIQPGRPMDPGASRVNGIYDSDLIGAPAFADVAGEFLDILDGALLVAHNARFDAAFLGLELHILGSTRPSEPEPTLPNPWLCTLQLAREHFYFGRNSLGNVARMLGVRTGRAHRALNDANTTAEVLKRMIHELEELQLETVGDYMHAQGGAIYTPPQPKVRLPPSLVDVLTGNRPIRIRYKSVSGETERIIRPLYLTEREGISYLIAHCHLRAAQRTFRIDRILSAEAV